MSSSSNNEYDGSGTCRNNKMIIVAAYMVCVKTDNYISVALPVIIKF